MWEPFSFAITLYADIPKFGNPVAPSQIKLREANRLLNKQLQVQQALLMDQSMEGRGNGLDIETLQKPLSPGVQGLLKSGSQKNNILFL